MQIELKNIFRINRILKKNHEIHDYLELTRASTVSHTTSIKPNGLFLANYELSNNHCYSALSITVTLRSVVTITAVVTVTAVIPHWPKTGIRTLGAGKTANNERQLFNHVKLSDIFFQKLITKETPTKDIA